MSFDSLTLARMIEPRSRVLGDHPKRLLEGGASISTPIFSSSVEPAVLSSTALGAEQRDATGHDASSTAARWRGASSTRAFFSFISVSVAAPTWITATPPESFASRSELLAVVVAGRLVDRDLDLGDLALDVVVLALAVDDGGVVLVDHHPLGLAEVTEHGVRSQRRAPREDHLAAGQLGDVDQHLLATVAEARGLHGRDLERALELVDHQGRARASPSTSSAISRRGLPAWATFSSTGSRSFMAEIFLSWDQM
ncbi:MAG: hypothetical protein R2909_05225 [Gemmatimonadales bacterium]